MSPPFRKTSFVPLNHTESELAERLPVQLSPNVSVQKVSGILSEQHFDLWREYIAQRDRKDFSSIRIALVNDFTSIEHLGEKEEASHDLLYKHFLCLRIVKPTRTRFALVQFTRKDSGEIDVSRLTHPVPTPMNFPDSQQINSLGLEDLRLARNLLQAFMHLATHGPENVRRAVRYYEEGYANVNDPVLQLIVWAMAIEAVFASEGDSLPRPALFERIEKFVPFDADIFSESPEREFVKFPPISIRAVIDDVFSMRDKFVHGLWIPPGWKERISYTSMSNEPVHYVDVLREAASFILRKLLMGHLQASARQIQGD